MSNTVAQVILTDPPALSAVATGAETKSQVYTLTAPTLASSPLTIKHPDGTGFNWLPTELVYRDAAGQKDYLVGSSPSSLITRGCEARYARIFPTADDVFCATANGVKHWTVLHEPPRQPAAYLGIGIEFGVSGLITGIPLPPGRHKEIATDRFNFPEPVAKDLNGKEIKGRYEVVDSAQGQQLFIWFPVSFLQTATYPLMLDPTIVVSAAYDTSGNGARHLIRLSNGWLLSCAVDSAWLRIYKSTDSGTAWSELCYWGTSGAGISTPALVPISGTTVGVLAQRGGFVYFLKFDAATQTDVNLWGTSAEQTLDTPNTGESGGCSLAIDGTGVLHAAWSIKSTTYPNSLNIRYRKSTDSGATWATTTQMTSTNTTNVDYTNPCVVVRSNGYPNVLCQYKDTGGANQILAFNWNGSAFNAVVNIYNGGSYAQTNLCAAVDSNDVIHVVWHGLDSTDTTKQNVRFSKSSDGGATWSAATKLTSGNTYDQLNPSITIDGSNKIRVFWHGIDSAVNVTYYNIRKIESTDVGATWSSISTMTSNTTNNAQHPATLWSKFNMNSADAVRWIYQDQQATAVKYDSITLNAAPNAPTLGTRANFDATASAAFTWTFSDPDSGNTQSAYQLLIKRVSDGVTVVDTGKVASTTSSHTLTAATLSNNVQYQWQVKTWDNSDVVGPYSSLATFNTSAKPTVSITTPATDGATVSSSSLTVQWSFSDPESEGQSACQVKLTDNADAVLWDSGKVTDVNARSRTINYTLVNSTNYKVKVTLWDARDVASVETVRTFVTSFTPPAIPTIILSQGASYIGIAITNPTPTGGQPTVNNNDIYRRIQGETTWKRIVTGIASSGSYNDYAAASGVTYQYKVTANGSNATSSDSAIASQSITLTGVWLHDIADPAGTVYNFKFDGGGRDSNWQAEVSIMQFAGRSRPVAEFGESGEGKVSAQLQMLKDDPDYTKLDTLVKRQGTVCWRDGRGRKLFGVIIVLPIQDQHWGYTTTIEVIEIAQLEEV